MKKKVLIFNGYYYPSKNCGGPITSIENIVNGCCNEFDFYIVCYNHDFGDLTPFEKEVNKWYKVGNAQVFYVEPGYLDFSKERMKQFFESLQPDLIWFSGVLTPNNKIVTVLNARKMNIPVLFSPRGEVSADRVKLKAYKKIPYLNFLKLSGMYKKCYFHGTSDDEIEGIIKYFNPDKNHIFKVANIAIMPQEDVVKHKKEEGTVRLFFFSRIHEVKNLLFAIQCINQCKNNVCFDIYGPIESKEYWKECEEEIAKSPENVQIKYCGVLQHNELSETIQNHDAFLFPTINENYGHVIAESLANSRPVILSKGTTPWDDLDNKAGFVVSLSEPSEFTNKIDYYASMDGIEFDNVIVSTKIYFREKMGQDDALKGHINMLRAIMSTKEKRNTP